MIHLNPVFSIYLFAPFLDIYLTPVITPFSLVFSTSLVTTTGFLTENFNDRPTFPCPIYGISCSNVKHCDKYASRTSDHRGKDSNAMARLDVEIVCGKSSHKSSDIHRSFRGFHRLFLPFAFIFRNHRIYLTVI